MFNYYLEKIAIGLGIIIRCSIIWVVIEFALYLFKDHKFNFLSLYLTIGLIVLTILIGLIPALLEIFKRDKNAKKNS